MYNEDVVPFELPKFFVGYRTLTTEVLIDEHMSFRNKYVSQVETLESGSDIVSGHIFCHFVQIAGTVAIVSMLEELK